ncbi:MAG: ABC transporter ATP-binding protein [Candidatus Dormibacteria bacterium]
MSAPAAAKPLYQMQQVERRYLKGAAQVLAVRGVDLEIGGGEFVSIEGPSGSGKSTLLQLLGALDTPTSGRIEFDNQDLSRAGDRFLTAIRGSRIGFIFQQFNLIPTLSALDNVSIAVDPKQSIKKRRERALELLTSVGLAQRAQHLPSGMSGGEQQRVAIARALANHPEVIIADEPTGNLDTQNAADIMSLLDGLRADTGVTIIVATHDEEVAKHATRRIRMRDGAIVSDTHAVEESSAP